MDLKALSVCRIILLNRLILLFAFLLVASALPAAAQQPFADLYYFTGTPPMPRLHHAKVEVVLNFTPLELHFSIEKKGSELTAQEAEEGLGVPEIFDGAPFQ
jgi:hypothetical protein